MMIAISVGTALAMIGLSVIIGLGNMITFVAGMVFGIGLMVLLFFHYLDNWEARQ